MNLSHSRSRFELQALRGRHRFRALLAGAAAAATLTAAILAGSRNLENFDVALLGYALGTICLAFGVGYRVVLWATNPSARRFLMRSRQGFSLRTAGRARVGELIRTVGSTLLLQRFIAARSVPRWLAHQGLFWGAVSAALITFPLTFGWVHFRAVQGNPSAYWIHVMGVRTVQIDALGIVGWLAFHGLNLSAILVIAGGGWFLHRRWRERAGNVTRLGRDLAPLLSLLAISVTGLLLTVSSTWMGGFAYRPLALVHMFTVVLTLIWIPFGKFFHSVQRPAMAGVQLHKQASFAAAGPAPCRSCGAPVEGAAFLGDLQATMNELDLNYTGWLKTCPACKRLARGAGYLEHVKGGF